MRRALLHNPSKRHLFSHFKEKFKNMTNKVKDFSKNLLNPLSEKGKAFGQKVVEKLKDAGKMVGDEMLNKLTEVGSKVGHDVMEKVKAEVDSKLEHLEKHAEDVILQKLENKAADYQQALMNKLAEFTKPSEQKSEGSSSLLSKVVHYAFGKSRGSASLGSVPSDNPNFLTNIGKSVMSVFNKAVHKVSLLKSKTKTSPAWPSSIFTIFFYMFVPFALSVVFPFLTGVFLPVVGIISLVWIVAMIYSLIKNNGNEIISKITSIFGHSRKKVKEDIAEDETPEYED